MLKRIEHPGPKLSEHDLEEAERRLGCALPEAYRAFLLDHNGGRPIPAVTPFAAQSSDEGAPAFIEIDVFYKIHSDPGYDPNFAEVTDPDLDLVRLMEWYDSAQIELTRLPIGSPGGDYHLVLGIHGSDRGKVFLWYSQEMPFDDEMSLVAESFTDLVDGLDYFDWEQPWRELIDEGDVGGLESWLNDGGDANAEDRIVRGDTPLGYAVERGESEIVALLRRNGARRKDFMVYAAIHQRNLPMVKLFLQEGMSHQERELAASELGQTDDDELNRLLHKP